MENVKVLFQNLEKLEEHIDPSLFRNGLEKLLLEVKKNRTVTCIRAQLGEHA